MQSCILFSENFEILKRKVLNRISKAQIHSLSRRRKKKLENISLDKKSGFSFEFWNLILRNIAKEINSVIKRSTHKIRSFQRLNLG